MTITIAEYGGSTTTPQRRFSIVAISDDAGVVTAVNSYDEWGAPAATNTGRFQYAGRPWIQR